MAPKMYINMRKKLIEYFVGSVVVMTAVVLIIDIQNRDNLTLRTLLIQAVIALVGSAALTLIRYFLLKKNLRNNNKQKQ